jgi:hypothetical protein
MVRRCPTANEEEIQMTEKLFGSGRRGGVLLIAGAMLGAVVAGPGLSMAEKAMNLTTTTADKRYIKRGETLAAGKTVENKIDKFVGTTFSPIATAKINAPGPGFLYIVGSVSAKDDTTTVTPGNGTKLDYRLSVGSTALSKTPDSFELLLPDLGVGNDDRQNGSVNGVFKVTQKGQLKVNLDAQVAGTTPSATILGRSVSVIFVPKGKLPKTTTPPTKPVKEPTG